MLNWLTGVFPIRSPKPDLSLWSSFRVIGNFYCIDLFIKYSIQSKAKRATSTQRV